MAIGEFGGAPVSGGPVVSSGLYWLYEMAHAALNPSRAMASMTGLYFKNPLNPLAHTPFGKTMSANAIVTALLWKPSDCWNDRPAPPLTVSNAPAAGAAVTFWY